MAPDLTSPTDAVSKRLLLSERFEVIRPLGEGAAGSVFLVRDLKENGRRVALKVLEDPKAFDEHTLRRFREELITLRSLRHPNLIEAYDLIDLDDTLAFTMEFVEGADLGRLFRDKRMPYSEIDRICIDLLDGLQELHAHDILHRDVKLENILIGRDGSVKLSDLGLMKRTDNKGITKPGILLGTAQYMPPEYIKRGKYDVRGDLYAVGIVLFELLTGKRRLAELNGNKVIEHLIKTKFEIPEIALTDAPVKYRKILRRALAVDPEGRFRSAYEMREAFRNDGLDPDHRESGVHINSKLMRSDFEQGRPLVAWGKGKPELKNQTLFRYFISIMSLSFLTVIAVSYLRTGVLAVSLTRGDYTGSVATDRGPTEIFISVHPDSVTVRTKFGSCTPGTIDTKESLLHCGKKTFLFSIDHSDLEKFSGLFTDRIAGKSYRFAVNRAP